MLKLITKEEDKKIQNQTRLLEVFKEGAYLTSGARLFQSGAR